MSHKTKILILALLLALGGALSSFGPPVRAQINTPTSTAVPLLTATPQPDGSVIHEVQPGDTLWSIAIAYEIQIAEINRLNGLAENAVVRPGDQIVVAPSFTPTLPPTETVTPLPPTITARPTATPRPPTLTATTAFSLTPTPRPLLPELPAFQGDFRRNVGIGMIAICAVGILLVIVNALRGK